MFKKGERAVKNKIQDKKVICIAVLVIILLNICGCGSQETAENEIWGRADAKEIDVNSKVAGRVVQLLVKEGDTVKEGQVLAYIDKRDLVAQREQLVANIQSLQEQEEQASAQSSLNGGTVYSSLDMAQAGLKQAKTELDLAKSDYDRFSNLVESGAISQQMFDEYKTKYEAAQATYMQASSAVDKANAGLLQTGVDKANENVVDKKIDQAKAALQQLDVQLDETTIRAPFDGVITEKYIEEGSMISLGTPLVAVQDPTDNWVDFKIPETELSKFYVNQDLNLIARDNTTQVSGTVSDISKKADFATQRATSERGDSTDIISFNVKVQVNSDKLRPGMRFKLNGGAAS